MEKRSSSLIGGHFARVAIRTSMERRAHCNAGALALQCCGQNHQVSLLFSRAYRHVPTSMYSLQIGGICSVSFNPFLKRCGRASISVGKKKMLGTLLRSWFCSICFSGKITGRQLANRVPQGENAKTRRDLMISLSLGLTDIYNIFHDCVLTPEKVANFGKGPMKAESWHQGVLEFCRLHCELDIAVRDAYGRTDLDLRHDFHEVEPIPESDRVRFTISPTARMEVPRRLLAQNRERAAAGIASASKGATNPGKQSKSSDAPMLEMFASE